MFTEDCLSELVHLAHLRIIFSRQIEQNDGRLRFERLLPRILTHSPLRTCTIHASQPLEFSQMQSPSPVEYLDIDYCSFQSITTLFEFTPCLRHLRVTIVETPLPKEEKLSTFRQAPPLLISLKLNLNIQSSDALTDFLKLFSKLEKLSIVSYLYIERSIDNSWFPFINEHLPELNSFQWESPVLLQKNGTAQHQSFNCPKSWNLQEKTVPINDYYSRMKVLIVSH